MKLNKIIFLKYFPLFFFVFSSYFSTPAYAIISDGANAIDLIGHYTENDGVTPDYTESAANDVPNLYGLSSSGYGIALDSVNHRLFLPDTNNHRVLIFDLDSNNQLIDKTPDYVLGQSTFYTNSSATTQAGMRNPVSVAYDSTNNRLFVVDSTNNRVTVYDVASITNGENAVNVLGQSTFTDSSVATTQAGMSGPSDVVYDSTNNRLFVSQVAQGRVTVYDVASITDGENAVNVLGQSTFTVGTSATTQAGMCGPRGMAYDSTNNRLFVAQYCSNRVNVYDVASITNGENAVNVLGQSTFTGSSAANTQAGMRNPVSVAYDSTNNRLFVAQADNNRVTVYDVASITNGENAVNVLGQSTFTGSASADTQAGMNGPGGVVYDSTNNRLFVAQSGNNRVTVYDVASITDGEDAIDLIGHYTENDGVTPDYTKSAANDVPNLYGLSSSGYGIAIDSVNHRLFLPDTFNNRVLIFDLNSSNKLVDKTPDYVLGQSTFYTNSSATTQAGMNSPSSVVYDSTNNRLFVAQSGNNRVTVYDVASITNGEDAVNVLGQSTFTGSASANTQAGMSGPRGMAYDSTNNRLFVTNVSNNRVTVYDVASITNGENAVNVLGQSTFTGSASATTQAGMSNPSSVAYDSTNNRLFVVDSTNNRVTVYDVASITNGENAVNVLGQSTFTVGTSANTQAGMNGPGGVVYDSTNNRLFVAQYGNHRVTVYDVASITNGEDAVNVLGQSTFTGSASANTQAGMSGPRGMAYDSTNKRLFVAQSGNNRVTVYDVALAATNSIISGTVYTDEGITNIGSGKTVRLLVNGTSVTTGITDASGQYSVTTESLLVSGDIVTVHIDDAVEDGVTITRSETADISGLDIYIDHIIVRNEDGTAASLANLDTANDGDADIITLYTDGASPVFQSGKELYIWTGKTFTPAAALTLGDLNIQGTLNMGSNTLTISGNMVNAGTFTSTGTTSLNGTNQTITPTSAITFGTLSKVESTDDSTDKILTLAGDITITTALNLDGFDVDDRLNIVSSIPGTTRSITFTDAATFTGDFLDVMDSTIVDTSTGITAPLNPANTLNSGNTTNWFSFDFTISPGTDVSLAEGVTNTTTYTVVLDSPPTSDVVIDISDASSAIDVDTSSLTFTTLNWDIAQDVSVTAPEDVNLTSEADQIITFTVVDLSSDDAYDSVVDKTRQIDVTDNDVAGFTLSATTVSVAEDAGTDTFTVVLDAEPGSDVVISVISDSLSDATVSTSTLVFTSLDWDTPQTITVTGVNDDVDTASNDIATITVAIVDDSSDDNFDVVIDQTVTVTAVDDDTAGVTTGPGITITEVSSDTVSVVIDSEPLSNVVLNISSSNTLAATVSPSTLTFTPANWDTPQLVTVTGVADSGLSDVSVTVVVTVNDSLSSNEYDPIADETVSVEVTNVDVAPEEEEEEEPEPKSKHRSRSSARSRVRNLIAMGKIKEAEEIKQSFPNAFKDDQIISNTASIAQFTRSLEKGDEGEDVRNLQKFLNSRGYTIVTSGPGSPNNETNLFGESTRQALIIFQKDNNLQPSVGYFGLLTRALVNSMSGNAPVSSLVTPISSQDLELGMSNDDVIRLQGYLVAQDLGPAARALKAHGVTGYFGELTKAAVIEFQKVKGIQPTNGRVEPLMRAAMGI